MPGDLSEEELAAYFALRGASDRLQRAVTRHLRGHDLTEVQFAILAQLGTAAGAGGVAVGGVAMGDLARRLVITKSGLSYQAGQLEARGLIARRGSEADERAILVSLTGAGRELLAQVMPAHVALVRELFIDRVAAADLATIRQVLQRIATGS
jgi:DNA-binding MarR family transcriptional regulator